MQRVSFFAIFAVKNEDNHFEYMKKILRYTASMAVVILFCVMFSGCLRQDYIMFEDGDFDGIEFSDYDLLQNAELDMDDVDRN